MNDRRKISVNGVISVALALDGEDRLHGSAEISLKGIPVEEDRDSFLEEARTVAAEAAISSKGNEAKLREAVRLAVRRAATDWTGKKPVVDVIIIRI